MNKFFVISISSLFMTACSMTLPVKGRIQQSSETFIGTATGYLNGGGTIEVNTTNGVLCTGDFVYITNRNGRGVFECDDNRTGPFEFVSTGKSGAGTGTLDGHPFTFTFGN